MIAVVFELSALGLMLVGTGREKANLSDAELANISGACNCFTRTPEAVCGGAEQLTIGCNPQPGCGCKTVVHHDCERNHYTLTTQPGNYEWAQKMFVAQPAPR